MYFLEYSVITWNVEQHNDKERIVGIERNVVFVGQEIRILLSDVQWRHIFESSVDANKFALLFLFLFY